MKSFPAPMISLELSDEERIDMDCAMPSMPKAPEFPWGTRITLCEKELDKLNLDHQSAQVGGMVHGHFMARITSVSTDDRADGVSCRVEMQIEDLSIESEDDENEEADEEEKPKKKSRLYG